MTTAVVDQIPMPPSVDEDRRVQRHTTQRRELEDKLARVTARAASLRAELAQLRRALHADDVNRLLGGGEVQPGAPARLAQLDAELLETNAAVTATRDALEQHTIIAAGVRTQVEVEIRQQMEAAIIAMMKQLIPAVETVHAQTLQLQHQVYERAPGLLVPPSQLLSMWLQQAHTLVGGR